MGRRKKNEVQEEERVHIGREWMKLKARSVGQTQEEEELGTTERPGREQLFLSINQCREMYRSPGEFTIVPE